MLRAGPREGGRTEDEEEERWDEVTEVLALVEKESVLSPIQVRCGDQKLS